MRCARRRRGRFEAHARLPRQWIGFLQDYFNPEISFAILSTVPGETTSRQPVSVRRSTTYRARLASFVGAIGGRFPLVRASAVATARAIAAARLSGVSFLPMI